MITIKRFLIFLVALIIILPNLSFTLSAAEPYKAYSYSTTNEGTVALAAPQAYVPERIYNSKSLGVELKAPEDLIFDSKGNMYICDQAMNAVYIFDSELKPLKTVNTFINNGKTDKFLEPKGIFYTSDGLLYVADSGNNRVVAINSDNKAVFVLENIKSEFLPKDYTFVPQKVLVDSSNRIFVLAKNVNEGIMQFTQSGNFLGFFGSNKVVTSPLTTIWKKLMTDEQAAKLEQYIPVEYANFSLDSKGFIYAVSSVSQAGDLVRRLNISGDDVLVRNPIDGKKEVKGDLIFPYSGVTGITGPSAFIDVTSDELGNYYVLDNTRGRIFTYDDEGNMLFVFGSIGSEQAGSFSSPSAIAYRDGKIYALDREAAEVIVFSPTEYADTLLSAMSLYVKQDYKASLEKWEEIIKRNNNCNLAYYKAGYCLYRLKHYSEAMKYFKLVDAKQAYSDASVKYNRDYMDKNFSTIISVSIAIVAVAVIAVISLRRIKKHNGKRREQL